MLKLAYTVLFLTLWLIILYVYNVNAKKLSLASFLRKKYMLVATGILGIWLIFQIALHNTGFYYDLTLPPRIPLVMILPLITFTIVFTRVHRSNKILQVIPIYVPIAFQSFRACIESLFYATFLQGILPIQVTFAGANYDILLGISAIFVSIYTAKNTHPNKRFLLFWNVLGICIVLFAAFTFISSFYFPEIWGQTNSKISLEFNQFPYLLLPAFIMPSAIFMHVLSITQLLQNKQN
ncbi:hypothetical protein [Seonamhaeicola marinus]|uniref:Uncharacterized protein n=1 Tax=Seonamhaeicola marinus TaxID=1912246 RepID=A0A5D0HJ02_9FLAO|nr:hypothetical protein [Seonamhaeicola marinus]TYA71363.1 hypothetical protein FUA24_17420 [Seonamhaeicola marinus]